MMKFYMELEVKSVDVTPEKFDEVFDEIADALHECTGIENADLAGNSETLVLTFSMDISGDDEIAALTTGLAAARTALHSSGGATPGWEKHFSFLRHMLEKEPGTKNSGLVDA